MDISPVCKILIPTLNYETLFGVRVLEKLGIHNMCQGGGMHDSTETSKPLLIAFGQIEK